MARRLPGIQFVAAPPPLPEVLPRMDVAAFVGLAASGPLHTPVVVEDPVRFREIFGEDLTLAYRGAQPYRAFLAGAVRDFFAGGGRRCWVVRVADQKAETASFPVPGLYQISTGTTVTPTALMARSAGAWSDGLRAGATLVQDALGPAEVKWDGDEIRLQVGVGARRLLRPGDLLRARFADLTLFLAVRELPGGLVSGQAVWIDSGAGSPPVRLAAPDAKALLKDWVNGVEAQRLALSLHAIEASGGGLRLDELGFHPDHPRYLGALPTDLELYQGRWREADGERQERPALWRLADHPRFPFAASGGSPLYLPIGVGATLDEAALAGAAHSAKSTAERNGLSEFSADYFLDDELRGHTPDGLAVAAAAKVEVRMEAARGIHSLWPVREVTMLSVPDAVHPGWAMAVGTEPDLLWAPKISVSWPNAKRLHWTTIGGALSYEIQVGTDPGMTGAPLRIVPVQLKAPVRTKASLPLDDLTPSADPCDAVRYYRVRARRSGEIGPWSKTLRVEHPRPDFHPQPRPYLSTPSLRLVGSSLIWTGTKSGRYEVQSAKDPALDGAMSRMVHGHTLSVTPAMGPIIYWRVRRVTETMISPWSQTILQLSPQTAEELRVAESGEQGSLDASAATMALHREGLTLAVARADLVTLMALPVSAREAEARAHVEALQGHFGYEATPLSYGALFGPWIQVSDLQSATATVALRPPDGAIAGLYARRTLAAGAWIAAAGQPLDGAVNVWPGGLDGGALIATAVNPIQITPAGIVPRGQTTLATEEELVAMNVRRLLILLRRLAIREGANLVFQANGPSLWDQVESEFTTVLTGLWQRGAFQGAVMEEGFRVHVGPGGEGQLVVTIQVAPSRPLTFLTVRLVQSLAGGTQVTEGVL